MAKVVFSALVSDIRGRLGDDIYSYQRGVHYIRKYVPKSYDPNTPRQQFTKSNFSYLTFVWNYFTQFDKMLWRRYASVTGNCKTGITAFRKINLTLLAADHADLTIRTFPPQTPSTPTAPYGFQVSHTSSTTNVISWQHPQNDSNWVQLFYNLIWNYSDHFNQHWMFLKTVRSDVGQIVHTHEYPEGTVMYYKTRSIDSWGRTTPYTHSIEVTS